MFLVIIYIICIFYQRHTRIPPTSTMEFFEILVNSSQLLNNITKYSDLDVVRGPRSTSNWKVTLFPLVNLLNKQGKARCHLLVLIWNLDSHSGNYCYNITTYVFYFSSFFEISFSFSKNLAFSTICYTMYCLKKKLAKLI